MYTEPIGEVNTLQEPEENYKTGWVSIYRSVKEHWLFPKNRPLTEFEAWIIILLEVNHCDNKVRIGNSFIDCKRGESIKSLQTWSNLFHWNKSKTRRFFDLLKKDFMICTKSVQKSTHLTVCNYANYQDRRNDNETIMKRKRNDSETMATPNNNDNNVNNENKYIDVFNFKNSLLKLGIDKQIVSDWLKVRKTKKASNTETAFNHIKKQIELSGISANECIKIAVERSWQGFKAEWVKDIKPIQIKSELIEETYFDKLKNGTL